MAGYISSEQQRFIDYLKAENQILREQLGTKRPGLTDDQHRELAVLGKALGKAKLVEICSIVTPDTILRWHHKLIARKYDGSSMRKPGRPRVMQEIRRFVVLKATENRSWGYKRIEGELSQLGHRDARTTVANILREHGIEPVPERAKRATWAEFLNTHWGSIAATDFFTIEAWTLKGLTRFCVLFVIDISTRRVRITGISDRPHGAQVERLMRGLLDDFDGFLLPHRYLIRDRDPLFTKAVDDLLKSAGVEPVILPPRSPNLNAYAERFIRSIKSECLGRIIPIGERHLRHAIDKYVEHYNGDRPHQGLGNQLIDPPERPPTTTGVVTRDEHLGGLLRSYSRAAQPAQL